MDFLISLPSDKKENQMMPMPLKSIISLGILLLSFPLLGLAQDGESYLLQRILKQYTEAYGGFRDADSLTSLSVEGRIEQGGQTFDFLMRKKRPYSFRYRLSSDHNTAITGYNGRAGWTRIEANGEVTIETLKGEDLYKLRDLARFEGPLFRHLEKRENKIRFLKRDNFEGQAVYILEVIGTRNSRSHYYLDTQKAHILRIDEIDEKGEVAQQTIYRYYREVEGFPFAHEVETRVGDKTLSLARVGEINVNPGLLSFYFEKPKR